MISYVVCYGCKQKKGNRRGFKNMKKIAAVLVLALVAMTAVFAEPVKQGSDVKVKLTITGTTEFGFTKEKVSSTKGFVGNLAEEEYNMANYKNNNLVFYASVISTNQKGVSVTVKMPKVITSETGATIAINYVDLPADVSEVDGKYNKVFNYGANNEKLYASEKIELGLADYSNNVSGTYTGTFTMVVTDNN